MPRRSRPRPGARSLLPGEVELEVGEEIFGQRLDGAGAEAVDQDFQISAPNASRQGLSPAVSYTSASGQYLVVWLGTKPQEVGELDDLEIVGQRLEF